MAPAPLPAAPEQKIGDLQVLRGVAIALVLLEHAAFTGPVFAALPHPVATPFWLGVDVFFLISGYVIVTSLMRDRFEPLSFFVKRVFRLTPALLILVGIAVVAHVALREDLPAVGRKEWLPDPGRFGPMCASVVFGYFALMIYDAAGGALLGVAWSLSVEDQFYAALAVAGLASVLVHGRRAPKWTARTLLVLAAGMYLFFLALRVWSGLGGRDPLTLSWKLIYLSAFRFDFLALGVVLAFVDRKYRGRVGAIFASRGPAWAPVLLGLPLSLAAVCGGDGTLTRPVFGVVLPAAGVCFGLLVLAAAHDRALPADRGRAYRFWTYLGDRSYTIYLFHCPAMLAGWVVLAAAFGPGVRTGSIGVGVLHAAVSLAILLPFVELVYRGVELPLTAVGRRLAKRVRVIPAEETAAPVAVVVGPDRRAA